MTTWISGHEKDSIRVNIAVGLIILVVMAMIANSQGGSDIHSNLIRELEEVIKHKDLWPMDNYDILGTLLIGAGLMIAASGGVGGGGIVVPLLIIVFGFHPKSAIPLSNFTILGSSIMNMILNIPKVHPDANRPLVDWDLILVMEPLTMAGAVST